MNYVLIDYIHIKNCKQHLTIDDILQYLMSMPVEVEIRKTEARWEIWNKRYGNIIAAIYKEQE